MKKASNPLPPVNVRPAPPCAPPKKEDSMKLNPNISAQVQRVAVKLQELVDRKYRGKVEVVFYPHGVIKGVKVPEFMIVDGSEK